MDGGFGSYANGSELDELPSVFKREDLTNKVEGRTLINKTTLAIC
mgnify:CR=1 FL=1